MADLGFCEAGGCTGCLGVVGRTVQCLACGTPAPREDENGRTIDGPAQRLQAEIDAGWKRYEQSEAEHKARVAESDERERRAREARRDRPAPPKPVHFSAVTPAGSGPAQPPEGAVAVAEPPRRKK